MKSILPAFIAGNLRYKFIALAIPLALAIGIAVFTTFFFMARDIVRDVSDRTATNQVLLDKTRAELPLMREITLAEMLTTDPTIIAWARNIDDIDRREDGLRTLERYRNAFSDRSYFFVLNETQEYFGHGQSMYPGKELVQYQLSKSDPLDEWYFNTIKQPGRCLLNVDFNRVSLQTKVWFNCIVRDPGDGHVLGVVGSGLDLTTFINELQESMPDGVTSIYADVNGAIQAHPDIELIELNALTNRDNLKSTIFNLVDSDDDRERLTEALAAAKADPKTASSVNVSIDGEEYMMGISFIPQFKWFSISVMDLWTLAFGKYFLPLAALIAVAIVLSLSALGIALNKTVLQRVDRLDRAVTSFKNGEAPTVDEFADTGSDQIGRLRGNFNEMAAAVRRNTAELEHLVAERTRELEDLVGRDPMTGARNRRSFYEIAIEEQRRAERFGGRSSVLMLDLDHFKSVNDTHGHAAGDATIKALTDLCRKTLRDIDVFARMGGEEFAAILINTSVDDARTVAERIRKGMKETVLHGNGGDFTCTVSIGVAPWNPSADDIDKALMVADGALYEAKQNGRDQIVVAYRAE